LNFPDSPSPIAVRPTIVFPAEGRIPARFAAPEQHHREGGTRNLTSTSAFSERHQPPHPSLIIQTKIFSTAMHTAQSLITFHRYNQSLHASNQNPEPND